MRRMLLLCLVLLVPLWARAASFQVSPIRMTLSAGHTTDVLKVMNNSDTPTVVQLQIVAWSQVNGEDVYTSSRDLLATPPIFTIAPGNQQVVRVGMRIKPDAKQETSYRLFLTEVPPVPTPGFRGIQIALRMGIPIFVEPATTPEPKLRWSVTRLSPTELQINTANDGNAHVQILKLIVKVPNQTQPLAQENGGYVLPANQHSWTIKLTTPIADNTSLDVTADTDQGTLHAQLVLGK